MRARVLTVGVAVAAVVASVVVGLEPAWAGDPNGQYGWTSAQASGGQLTVQAGHTYWTPLGVAGLGAGVLSAASSTMVPVRTAADGWVVAPFALGWPPAPRTSSATRAPRTASPTRRARGTPQTATPPEVG